MKNEQARIREALRRFDVADDALMRETDVPVRDMRRIRDLRHDREQQLYDLIQAVRLYLKPA